MSKENGVDHLSVDELEQILYRKKRALRRQRLQRLKDEGRLVEVTGLTPPAAQPPGLARPEAKPTGALAHYTLTENQEETKEETAVAASPPPNPAKPGKIRRLFNKTLLFVEIGAVLGFIIVLVTLWRTQSELNTELDQVQRAEVAAIELPTPTNTPVIDLVVLPTGHRYVEGRSPEPVEAGDIPAHLLPAIQAYQPPPIPTPSPEQARVIKIPAIGVNHPIVEGVYDWEQLKRGVGHRIGSAQPGQTGNMVLAAHNDIYGEIFRYLDQLSPGDEVIVETEVRSYTYVITQIDIVDPTNVSVMDPTNYPSTTLISCYPYRINTQRIVVTADLKTDS